MKLILIVALLGVFLWVFVPNAVSWSHIRPAPARTVDKGMAYRTSFRSVRPRSGSDPISLIRRVSVEYGVPAGALYGIWKKESGGLRSGWGKGPAWHLARGLSHKGSHCMRRYGKRCLRQWEALKRLCAQRRRNGRHVCDPNKVRTSYAMAMGPMQHMPAEIIRIDADGKAVWTSRAADEDHDGIVDPDDLADAMAMTAKFLQHAHARADRHVRTDDAAWRWAVNRYYGSQHAGYYSGRNGHRGVGSYWKEWCARYGCAASGTAVALNGR